MREFFSSLLVQRPEEETHERGRKKKGTSFFSLWTYRGVPGGGRGRERLDAFFSPPTRRMKKKRGEDAQVEVALSKVWGGRSGKEKGEDGISSSSAFSTSREKRIRRGKKKGVRAEEKH